MATEITIVLFPWPFYAIAFHDDIAHCHHRIAFGDFLNEAVFKPLFKKRAVCCFLITFDTIILFVTQRKIIFCNLNSSNSDILG